MEEAIKKWVLSQNPECPRIKDLAVGDCFRYASRGKAFNKSYLKVMSIGKKRVTVQEFWAETNLPVGERKLYIDLDSPAPLERC